MTGVTKSNCHYSHFQRLKALEKINYLGNLPESPHAFYSYRQEHRPHFGCPGRFSSRLQWKLYASMVAWKTPMTLRRQGGFSTCTFKTHYAQLCPGKSHSREIRTVPWDLATRGRVCGCRLFYFLNFCECEQRSSGIFEFCHFSPLSICSWKTKAGDSVLL